MEVSLRSRAEQLASEMAGQATMIEELNGRIRLMMKAALKLVYLAIHEARRKWTMPIHHWKSTLNHFAIFFEDRMPKSIGN